MCVSKNMPIITQEENYKKSSYEKDHKKYKFVYTYVYMYWAWGN